MNKKNLPQVYKNNIFVKLFDKFKSLFYNRRKNREESQIVDDLNDGQSMQSQKNFMERVKVKEFQKDIEYEKKKFFKELEYNPDLLENFSVDRLEKILKYYLDENDKKRELLKKLTF